MATRSNLDILFDGDISLDRARAEIADRYMHGNPAAQSTVEALMFSLRKGADELARPDVLRRLAELDEQQLLDVAVQLQKFKPEIAPAWTEEQIEILAAVRRIL